MLIENTKHCEANIRRFEAPVEQHIDVVFDPQNAFIYAASTSHLAPPEAFGEFKAICDKHCLRPDHSGWRRSRRNVKIDVFRRLVADFAKLAGWAPERVRVDCHKPGSGFPFVMWLSELRLAEIFEWGLRENAETIGVINHKLSDGQPVKAGPFDLWPLEDDEDGRKMPRSVSRGLFQVF